MRFWKNQFSCRKKENLEIRKIFLTRLSFSFPRMWKFFMHLFEIMENCSSNFWPKSKKPRRYTSKVCRSIPQREIIIPLHMVDEYVYSCWTNQLLRHSEVSAPFLTPLTFWTSCKNITFFCICSVASLRKTVNDRSDKIWQKIRIHGNKNSRYTNVIQSY